MKGTEQFKATIKAYLDNRAMTDELFARKYQSTKRSIDDIVTYILNQVKNSGCCGFDDEEIFSMAVHIIDEPDLEIGKPVKCQVVVNHQVRLTDDEMAEAKKKAIEQFQREEIEKMRRPKTVSKPKTPNKQQELTLFDM